LKEHTVSTKAQQFRYAQERSGPKKAPARRRKPPPPSDSDAGARNLSRRAGRFARVATEESQSGKPSRKSSRPSENHGKNSTVLEYASRLRSQAPSRQHERR
jgi:hypothetical protein